MRVSSAAIKKFVNFWHNAVYDSPGGACRALTFALTRLSCFQQRRPNKNKKNKMSSEFQISAVR